MKIPTNEKREKMSIQRKILFAFIGVLILLVPMVLLLVRLHEDESPRLSFDSEITRIGQQAVLAVSASDQASGLRNVEVLLRQAELEVPLLKKEYPRQRWLFRAGPERFSEQFVVSPRELELRDGRVELVVRDTDYSWRGLMSGNSSEQVFTLLIDTQPPVINVSRNTRYVASGGSGMVRYSINEEVASHGVLINGFFHPGFPLSAERPGEYVAFVAVPHDADELDETLVVAEDLAGNEGRAGLVMNLRRVNRPHDRINIPESFLRQKMPEFASHYHQMEGELLKQFLFVNREVREKNDARIMELCRDSHPERLWSGAFLRMARSAQRAGFGDRRSYFYEGQLIDEQVHLGVDLASVRQADIQSANGGIVVLAEYLGIYGNTVVIDHGQGLFSLYSHLSQVDVEPGDRLDRGAVIGKSGVSGMAAGDHLHFSMMVNGIFVNPLEWWDRNWVENQLTP